MKVDSVDTLPKYNSLMRNVNDDNRHHFRHQSKELIKQILKLRTDISNLVTRARESIESCLHRTGISIINLEEMSDQAKRFLRRTESPTQTHREININDLNALKTVDSQIKKDLGLFKELNQILLKRLSDLMALEDNSKTCIIYDDLTNYQHKVLEIENTSLTEKERIDQQKSLSIEIHKKLDDFSKKYFQGFFELENKKDVKLEDIVEGLKSSPFAKFTIGVIGNSGIFFNSYKKGIYFSLTQICFY